MSSLTADAYALPPGAATQLGADGHVTLRGLAHARELAPVRAAVEREVLAHAKRLPDLEARDTYGRAFIQLGNLWARDPTIESFVRSPRFARVAAELLDVDGVRLYHDQALAKEPHGGHTPWHQDQVYWPLDTDDTITMWMPLVDVPVEAGTMTFASGSHRLGDLGSRVIGDESEDAYASLVPELGLREAPTGPMAAGDATFHRGWTLHRAPVNDTPRLRLVMTVIYFADGARVGPVDSPFREFDRQMWLSGRAPGERADAAGNPRLWPPGP